MIGTALLLASDDFSALSRIAMILVLAAVGLIALLLLRFFGRLYLRALLSRTRVTFFDLLGMWMRRVDAGFVIDTKIQAWRGGVSDVTTADIETHLAAGGRPRQVVQALIAARKGGVVLDYATAAAIDLSGRDILEVVRSALNSKTIDCPAAGAAADAVSAVAQDGVELRVKARVTIRTNPARLLGGALEDALSARVAQAIAAAVAAAPCHRELLENPQRLSQAAMVANCGQGTAFDVVSVDIVSLVIGENHAARLLTSQCEADMRRFQAELERCKALSEAMKLGNADLTESARSRARLAARPATGSKHGEAEKN